jgi:hypothetical protein
MSISYTIEVMASLHEPLGRIQQRQAQHTVVVYCLRQRNSSGEEQGIYHVCRRFLKREKRMPDNLCRSDSFRIGGRGGDIIFLRWSLKKGWKCGRHVFRSRMFRKDVDFPSGEERT